MNNRILTPNQEKILEKVSNTVGFIKAVHEELNDGTKGQLNLRKWAKCVCKYYTDKANIETKKHQTQEDLDDIIVIEKALIYQTSEKLCVSIKQVIDTFDKCRQIKYPLLNIELMIENIPEKIITKLYNLIEDPMSCEYEFISLVLRYHILLLNEGLFLSVDNEMYQKFYDSSVLSVLEAYGSPFNHMFKYCSLFEEDIVYGAYPRFEEYIERVTYPCRLLVNPPYTNRSIRVCIESLINYMNKHHGEFIVMLPVMINFEPLDKLLAYPGTQHIILDKDRYTLYSALRDTCIVAPLPMYMIVNLRGGCALYARQFLSDIAYHMRVKADNIIKSY